ncbi:MAG: VOC family protein [Dehalococcoidia bacterium]
MTTTAQAIDGRIFHVEVRSPDSTATSRFFEAAFAWPMVSPGGAYFAFDTPGDFEGHIAPRDAEDGADANAIAYIEVDDLDATLERLRTLGAELLTEAQEAPIGRYAYFREPGGSTWVAWQHAAADA